MCKLQILPVVSGYKVDGGFMNLLWVFAQVPATPIGLCSELLKSISHLLGWGILQNPGWVHQSGLFIFLASNWLVARSSIWTVVLGGVRIGYHSNHIWYRNRLEPVFDCSFENQLLSKSFMHLNFFQHIQDLVLWCFFPFFYPVCFHSHYTSTAASRYFPYYQGIWICTRSVPVSIQPFAKLFYAACYLFIRYNMIKTGSVYKQ